MTEAVASLTGLMKTLDHAFADPALLEEALTHPGGDTAGPDYERLEFLGDRVLGLVIADWLLRRFPAEPEGALAKRHTALVRRETLIDIADKIGLAAHLNLLEGEERDHPSRLADSLEAVIAAIYLDGGLPAARRFIERNWQAVIGDMTAPPQDSKTRLQEWAQARGLALPAYQTVERTGPDHRPTFTVEVAIEGFPSLSASGPTKRAAETEAAAAMLLRIEEAGHDE
ncbi:MAG: ribonuclease III [Alphaproteobacteria bacterium]|nr:ribonuclease III [Alphaproteobacteria bacterium]